LWFEPIEFPSKMVQCKFSLDLPLFFFLILDLSLHLGSPNHELSFELFSLVCGFEPIEFPSKMVQCKFSLDLPLFFGLGP